MRQPGEDVRAPFPKTRLSNTDALTQLELATDFTAAELRGLIPELQNEELAFIARWLADNFDNSDVGRANAEALRDYIGITIPAFNVAGDRRNDVSAINRSYWINTATRQVAGFREYEGAKRDLHDRVATARKTWPPIPDMQLY